MLSRPAAVIMVLLLVFITGIGSFKSMPLESAPDVKIPFIYVSVRMEGASPQDAERLIVKPLEKKLSNLEGLKEIKAQAVESYASIALEFQAGLDADKMKRNVREKVDEAKPDLPNDADEPVVTEVSFSLFPVVNVILSGTVPERTLLAAARDLEDRLEAINGVLDIDIAGNREEVVEVIVDPMMMESYNISPSQVLESITYNNVLVAAGAIDNEKGRFPVQVPGLIDGLKELYSVPVKVDNGSVLTVRDIAEVRRTFKDPRSFARVGGERAVVLQVKKRTGANIIETVERVKKVVEEVKPYWQGAIQVTYSQDTSNEIRTMVSDLINGLIIATLLVMLLVLTTMGLRSSALVALSIPGSFLLGVICLHLLGVTLNIVVLFSLILVVGMLVDDAIIVCEYADRKMVEGVPAKSAYLDAAKRMVWPVVSSTVTPVMVFLPLLFWPGVVGQFMKYMPITVIFTLGASLLMAMFFLPAIGQRIGGVGRVTEEERRAMIASEEGRLEDLKGASKRYASIVARLLNRPGVFVAVIFLVMIMVFTYYSFFGTGTEFFPEIEPENAVVQIKARGNLSTREKDEIIRAVESRVLDMAEIKVLYARSGEMGQGDYAEDLIGQLTVEFISWDKRRKADAILSEIKQRLADIPGIVVDEQKQQGGPPTGKPIQLEFRSQEWDVLNTEFAKFLELIKNDQDLINVEDTRPVPGIQWNLEVNREKAAQFGVSIAALGSMVRFVTNGLKVGSYHPDDSTEEIDFIVRYPEDVRTLSQLDRLRVYSNQGLIPVSNFVTRIPAHEVARINRSDGLKVLSFKSDLKPGILADDKVRQYAALLKDNPPDPKVSIRFKGEDEEQKAAGAFLANAFLIALASMLIVFVVQFNNLFQALVVMSAVFFSTVGVVLGLIITNQPFGVVMCGIGVIALAGIVVKNNIIFIDTYNHLRHNLAERYKGRERQLGYDCLMMTGVQGMRPSLLTAFSAVLGLLPMVFQMNIDLLERKISFGSPSSQWWTQLSASIAGGLTFATALTLFFTPCLIMWGYNLRSKPIFSRFLSAKRDLT